MIKSITLLLAAVFFALPVFAQDTAVRQKHFSHKKGLAVQGYDPVAYHSGGAKKGSSKITASHGGLTYRFSTEANKKAFQASPDKYEPLFGGWCAWAMKDGEKTKVNPKNFKVINGKTHLFFKTILGDTRKLWDKQGNDAAQTAKAAAQWKKITG